MRVRPARPTSPRAWLPVLLVAASGLATVQPSRAQSWESATGTGVLYAYNASNLAWIWCSSSSCTTNSSTFTNPSFAVPTVANGYIYVPTAGMTTVASNSTTCTSTPCSGILVYSGH